MQLLFVILEMLKVAPSSNWTHSRGMTSSGVFVSAPRLLRQAGVGVQAVYVKARISRITHLWPRAAISSDILEVTVLPSRFPARDGREAAVGATEVSRLLGVTFVRCVPLGLRNPPALSFSCSGGKMADWSPDTSACPRAVFQQELIDTWPLQSDWQQSGYSLKYWNFTFF